ncbi:MAG: hypothetical protein ABIN80_28985 [Dyadobacter sp.]|uniref:hypothetical protein n=1 Tax=Dyadobacter sp. TaxID=1914288 RepID=UPI00326378D0
MIRTIVTPDKPYISLDIPREYVGKEIEVIAFSKDEGIDEVIEPPKKVSFDAVNIDTRGYGFNRDEANGK